MALKTTERIKQVMKIIDPVNLINVGYPVFIKNTAVRTGNAQRKTTKQSTEIHAKYPYAKRLDNGWSKNKPEGMTKPTIKEIRDYIKKELGK